MGNTGALKIVVEAVILTSPIGLNGTNFGMKEAFDMVLKIIENLLNIRLMFNKVNPRIAAEIIHKTHIVFKTTRGCQSRAPNIRMHKF